MWTERAKEALSQAWLAIAEEFAAKIPFVSVHDLAIMATIPAGLAASMEAEIADPRLTETGMMLTVDRLKAAWSEAISIVEAQAEKMRARGLPTPSPRPLRVRLGEGPVDPAAWLPADCLTVAEIHDYLLGTLSYDDICAKINRLAPGPKLSPEVQSSALAQKSSDFPPAFHWPSQASQARPAVSASSLELPLLATEVLTETPLASVQFLDLPPIQILD